MTGTLEFNYLVSSMLILRTMIDFGSGTWPDLPMCDTETLVKHFSAVGSINCVKVPIKMSTICMPVVGTYYTVAHE